MVPLTPSSNGAGRAGATVIVAIPADATAGVAGVLLRERDLRSSPVGSTTVARIGHCRLVAWCANCRAGPTTRSSRSGAATSPTDAVARRRSCQARSSGFRTTRELRAAACWDPVSVDGPKTGRRRRVYRQTASAPRPVLMVPVAFEPPLPSGAFRGCRPIRRSTPTRAPRRTRQRSCRRHHAPRRDKRTGRSPWHRACRGAGTACRHSACGVHPRAEYERKVIGAGAAYGIAQGSAQSSRRQEAPEAQGTRSTCRDGASSSARCARAGAMSTAAAHSPSPQRWTVPTCSQRWVPAGARVSVCASPQRVGGGCEMRIRVGVGAWRDRVPCDRQRPPEDGVKTPCLHATVRGCGD